MRLAKMGKSCRHRRLKYGLGDKSRGLQSIIYINVSVPPSPPNSRHGANLVCAPALFALGLVSRARTMLAGDGSPAAKRALLPSELKVPSVVRCM